MDDGDDLFERAHVADREHGDLDSAQELYERAWAAGVIRAANRLGGLHRRRDDLAAAEAWCRRGADAGDPNAAYNLANLLDDEEETERLYRIAVEEGVAPAAYQLAHVVRERGDDAEYARLIRVAAEGGDDYAQNELGVLLAREGRHDEAELWYRRATDEGNATARHNLGCILENQDRTAAARRLFEQAWEEDGDAHAAYHVALGYVNDGLMGRAREWFERAAGAGDPAAMTKFGRLLDEEGDVPQAERWWRRAAEHDEAEAIFYLGVTADDDGRPDDAEAWYRRAADDDGSCALNLGILLAQREDYDEAERWLLRADELGEEKAAGNLETLRENRDRPG